MEETIGKLHSFRDHLQSLSISEQAKKDLYDKVRVILLCGIKETLGKTGLEMAAAILEIHDA
jgi:hypothetical protein